MCYFCYDCPSKLIWSSRVAQLVRNPPAGPDPGSIPGVWKIPWRRDRLPTPVFSGFPCGSAGKESPCNERDLSSIPELGRSPGEKNGHPLQYTGIWSITGHELYTKFQLKKKSGTPSYSLLFTGQKSCGSLMKGAEGLAHRTVGERLATGIFPSASPIQS